MTFLVGKSLEMVEYKHFRQTCCTINIHRYMIHTYVIYTMKRANKVYKGTRSRNKGAAIGVEWSIVEVLRH